MTQTGFLIAMAGVIGLMGTGLYGLLTSRNLIKLVIALQLLAKAAMLALVAAGALNGKTDVGQSLALTVMVADTLAAVMGIALGVQIRRRTGSLDVSKLASLRG